MTHLDTFTDLGPHSLGKGRVRLYNHSGYSMGEYVGPEGVVMIYTEEPSGRVLGYNEYGYLSMEYVYKGKEYRRVWCRSAHKSQLARLARQLARDVEEGNFSS